MTVARDPYRPFRARIEAVTDECAGPRPIRTYALAFADEPRPELDYLPGQCAQLSVLGAGEIFLSIASARDDSADRLEVSVMRVGKVTSALHRLAPGDHVGLRGPYGNGFPVASWRGKNLILIGGGIGQAPLRSVLHHALAHRAEFGRIAMFYGARSRAAMIYRDEFDALEERAGTGDIDLYISTDPADPAASAVAHDRIHYTGLVPQIVAAVAPSPEGAVAATCGPPVMIAGVVAELARLGFSGEQIHTTLERRMKCGIGLCGRCNLGPKLLCTDGPCFTVAELGALPEGLP